MKVTVFGVVAAILLGLLPFIDSDYIFYGAVNTKFFFIIGTIDVLLIWGAWSIYHGKLQIVWKRQWFFYALGATLFVFYTAAFLGVYPELSLWADILRGTGLLFLTHLALFAVLVGQAFTERDWSLLRRTILISSGVFSLLTIIDKYVFDYGGDFLWIDFAGEGLNFGNSTFAGVYLLLAFILGLIELKRSYGHHIWRKILLTSLASIALSPIFFRLEIFISGRGMGIGDALADPTLLLGSARASSATLFLLLLFLLGRYLIKRFFPKSLTQRVFVLWSAGMLVGITVAVGLLFTSGSVVQKAYIESSSEARIFVWNAGLEAFAERPLFGWGPENFSDAYERHLDNRLYLDENVGEVWFDRAHNVFVDTLVTVGVIGMLSLVVLIGTFLSVVYRSRKKGHIENTEAILLYSLVPAHLLQLQTSFDTVASYVLLGVIAGYALWLERKIAGEEEHPPASHFAQKAVALILAVLIIVSLKFVLFDEYERQRALIKTFTAVNLETQKELVERSLVRTSDFEGLRLSGASFLEGSLVLLAQPDSQLSVDTVLSVADIYEKHYLKYMDAHPGYYRVRMNYAYLLLIETVLGRDRTKEAQVIIRDSYTLSPDNPLTYALDALSELYSGNIKKAKDLAREGLALNPSIFFSQEVLLYIEEQELRFPRIGVLKLKNL